MDQLQELRKDLLKRYMDKAHASSRTLWADRLRKQGKDKVAAERKYEKRSTGLDRASQKVYSEAQQSDKYSSEDISSVENGKMPNTESEVPMQLTESQQTLFESYQTTIVPMLSEAIDLMALDEELADAMVDAVAEVLEDALTTIVTDGEQEELSGDELRQLVLEAITVVVEEATAEDEETEDAVDESVPTLLAMMELGDREAAQQVFNDILSNRIAATLSDIRQELTTMMFAPSLEMQEAIDLDTEEFMISLIEALNDLGLEYTEEELEGIAEEVSARTTERKRTHSWMKTWDAQDAEHKRDWKGAAKHWKGASLSAIHGRAKHTQASMSDRAKIVRAKAKSVSEESEVMDILVDVLGLNQLVESNTITTDQLQELSAKTYMRYALRKAGPSREDWAKNPEKAEADTKKTLERKNHATKMYNKKTWGEGVEQIDELSNKTLTNYIGRSAENLSANKYFAGMAANKKNAEKLFGRGNKRERGIKMAANKLAKRASES